MTALLKVMVWSVCRGLGHRCLVGLQGAQASVFSGSAGGSGIGVFEKEPHVILLCYQSGTSLGWLPQRQLMVAVEKLGRECQMF